MYNIMYNVVFAAVKFNTVCVELHLCSTFISVIDKLYNRWFFFCILLFDTNSLFDVFYILSS